MTDMILRPLIKLAAGMPVQRARKLLATVAAIAAAQGQGETVRGYKAAVAAAWERDMQPVRTALVAALHAAENERAEALQGFRRLLPGLLREINRTPSMARVLARAMVEGLLEEKEPVQGADGADMPGGMTPSHPSHRVAGITFSEEPVETDALKHWRSREILPTDRGSAELRAMASQIRDRSIFSARTTNAHYLGEVAHVVDEILGGNMGMAEGRLKLMRKLKELGYDPSVGFPEDMGSVPPAERGSLQDLSSERRIDLLLETNVRMAQGYAQMIAGLTEYGLFAYPAWELKRLYVRNIERGTPESRSAGWFQRWDDAGAAVDWEGAVQDQWIALKTSPIWDALGDGAGGYIDTLLNPYPPFAFRSGMAWKAVNRARCIELGLIEADTTLQQPAEQPTLAPQENDVQRAIREMPDDLREELMREFEEMERMGK